MSIVNQTSYLWDLLNGAVIFIKNYRLTLWVFLLFSIYKIKKIAFTKRESEREFWLFFSFSEIVYPKSNNRKQSQINSKII